MSEAISIESETYILLPNSLEREAYITYPIREFKFNDRLSFDFVFEGTPGEVLDLITEFQGYWLVDQAFEMGVRVDTKISGEDEVRTGTPEFEQVRVAGYTTFRLEDGSTGAVVEVTYAN